MCCFDEDLIVPLAALAIPLVAIAGWIMARVIRTVSAHRLVEAAVSERVALIARGVDPARIPSAAAVVGGWGHPDVAGYARHRAQGLLVWGFALLAGGVSFAVVTGMLDGWDGGDWPFGVVTASAGIALLVSAAILWPRGRQ